MWVFDHISIKKGAVLVLGDVYANFGKGCIGPNNIFESVFFKGIWLRLIYCSVIATQHCWNNLPKFSYLAALPLDVTKSFTTVDC